MSIVSVPPEWITSPQVVVKTKEGSSVHLECIARGEPVPVISVSRKQGTQALVDSPDYSDSLP